MKSITEIMLTIIHQLKLKGLLTERWPIIHSNVDLDLTPGRQKLLSIFYKFAKGHTVISLSTVYGNTVLNDIT